MSIYLGLGANSGDRKLNLNRALNELSADKNIQLLKRSSVYQTEPWGYSKQKDFLNAVIEIRTSMEPLDLLIFLQDIEKKIGRKKTFKWGPREIDIDILSYNGKNIESKQLQIPHPEMHQRIFVLIPLAEIAPFYIHPVKNISIWRMLRQCPENEVKWHSYFNDK